MLVHRWKDAVSLAEVLCKDRCLDAKGVWTSAALAHCHRRAIEQQDTPHVELGLQYSQRSNTVKKTELGFLVFFARSTVCWEEVQ